LRGAAVGSGFQHAYAGSCSCGGVTLSLLSDRKSELVQPRTDAHTCHFCAQHDGVWISDAAGLLVVDPGSTRITRFASEEVQFYFCIDYGDLTYAVYCDPYDGREVAVVRLALFSQIAPFALPAKQTSFENEPTEIARKRRLENWTPLDRK
jgi:hypothetical protein